jgi:hypothetical protein
MLQFRILDEDGETRYDGELRSIGSGHTAYHASLAIPERIGPGHYEIAVALAGQQRAALVPFIVTDAQAESRASVLREAFELSSEAGEKSASGQIEETIRLLERAVVLYTFAGADAPAWQSMASLSDLYLRRNDLESAKRVSLRARLLLERLDYPPEALQRCNDRIAEIEARQGTKVVSQASVSARRPRPK